MKRHEIIYALRAYTSHADLQAMLTWHTDALEKQLKLCREWGVPQKDFIFSWEEIRPLHARMLGVEDSWKVGIDKAIEGGDHSCLVTIHDAKKLDEPWLLSREEHRLLFDHDIIPDRYKRHD